MKGFYIHFSCLIVLSLATSVVVLGQGAAGGAADIIDESGDWETNAIWFDGSSPGLTNLQYIDSSPATMVNNKTEVVADGDLVFNTGVNGCKLYVNLGTLIVKGSVIFPPDKNNADIRVAAGATLIILGSLEMGKNNADGAVDGNLVVQLGISSSGNAAQIIGTGSVYSPGSSGNFTFNNPDAEQPLVNLETDFPDIAEYIDNNGTIPLPVNLLSFDVVKDSGATLTWATASEKDNDYFSIERSEDGVSFYEIAQVDGNGTTNQKIEYSYIDAFPIADVEYYRLLQVDYDGAYEYFAPKRVELSSVSSTASFSLFPSVVTEGKLTISSDEALYISDVSLVSLSGKDVINVNNRLFKTGLFSYSLNTSDLKTGMYVLKFNTSTNRSFSARFIIR